MLLFLSKLLPALLFPIGLTILLCLFAAWLALRRGAWAPAIVSLAAGAVLYAAACPPLGNRLLLRLERQNPPVAASPRAAAIVLLGGGMVAADAPRIHPETNWAGDRVIHAGRLWQQGRAPILVATGGYIQFLTGAVGSEAEQYASLLIELFGVPASAARLVAGSRTTVEDAALTARLFDSTGMKKEILLVTSASHMPRAAALFRKQGFVVHPEPTDFCAGENLAFRWFDLLPSAQALAQTGMALHEYLGLAAARITGRI